MEDIYIAIGVGVLSGVASAAVIELVLYIFRNLFLPRYRSAKYQGIDISGNWNGSVEHPDATDALTVNFDQMAQDVIGKCLVQKTERDSTTGKAKELTLEGSIKDGYLLLTGKNQDLKKQSYATFLLKVSGGGNKLVGTFSWVDSGTDEIKSCPFRLSR